MYYVCFEIDVRSPPLRLALRDAAEARNRSLSLPPFFIFFYIRAFSLVQAFTFWIARRVLHAVAVGRSVQFLRCHSNHRCNRPPSVAKL